MTYFDKECPGCGDELGANPSECNECGDWLEAQLATVHRQARTIRRLRTLADGYRARLASLPTGDATDNAVATMHETKHAGHASLPDAALWGQGRDAGIKAERARIVARLRAEAEREGWSGTEAHAMQAAADIIESEGSE